MKKKVMYENDLEAATAYNLAGKLTVIPGFPRNDAATTCLADWLMMICKGAEVAGEYWIPRRQAGWLVDAVIMEFENWQTGGGLPAVRSIFNRKFKPPPALVEYQMLPAPEIACTTCNDQGTVCDGTIQWCTCEQARLLRGESPNLVNVMNRQRERQAAEEQRRREIKATIARKLDERRRHAETDRTGAGEVSALRRRRLFGVLKDRASRILRWAVSR